MLGDDALIVLFPLVVEDLQAGVVDGGAQLVPDAHLVHSLVPDAVVGLVQLMEGQGVDRLVADDDLLLADRVLHVLQLHKSTALDEVHQDTLLDGDAAVEELADLVCVDQGNTGRLVWGHVDIALVREAVERALGRCA